jgi:hypothetical protein
MSRRLLAYSRGNGRLLAEHLGQVSKDQVWRVMRKHHLSLARLQSWCVGTDPEFSRKAADVVGPPQVDVGRNGLSATTASSAFQLFDRDPRQARLT